MVVVMVVMHQSGMAAACVLLAARQCVQAKRLFRVWFCDQQATGLLLLLLLLRAAHPHHTHSSNSATSMRRQQKMVMEMVVLVDAGGRRDVPCGAVNDDDALMMTMKQRELSIK
jgi:hypothetical protein